LLSLFIRTDEDWGKGAIFQKLATQNIHDLEFLGTFGVFFGFSNILEAWRLLK